MATAECTQDAILHFLTGRGGRATNRDLLDHFKPVLSPPVPVVVPGGDPDDEDPQKRRAAARETFKRCVDNVAFVKTDENGVKCVCLKKRYRRLVREENGDVRGTHGAGAAAMAATGPGQEEATGPGQEEATVPGQEEATVPGQEEATGPVPTPGQEEDASRCDNAVELDVIIMGTQTQQQPCATEERTERAERAERTTTSREGSVTTSGEEAPLRRQQQQHAQLSPAGSGYGNDKQARRGETRISPGTILVDSRKEENVVNCPQQQQQQQQPPVVVVEEGVANSASGGGGHDDDDDMGNAMGCGASEEKCVRAIDREPSPEIPQIAIIEASPLPAAADGSMFDLPGLLHHDQCGHHGGGGDVHSGTTAEQGSRRRNSTGSLHSLRSSHPSDDDDDDGGDDPRSRGSLSGSGDDGGATPRASRQNFIELMMNSSPHVRRSLALRNSVQLSRCKDDDSASLASSSAATDGEDDRRSAVVALDPLEHAWMLRASDAASEWADLETLLADEPALLARRDFVTGFTALHWAAKHGRAELLALLVNFARLSGGVAVADVDARSGAGGGYTPLHLAAMHGHGDVAKLLVGAYGADTEVRDYSGRKACQYLSDNAATDIREIVGGAPSGTNGPAGDPLDLENALNGAGGARRRLSNVLLQHHPHLNPLKLLHHHHSDEDDVDNDVAADGHRRRPRGGSGSGKPVRRKSSLGDRMRPKLQRLRERTSRAVHSVSFHDAEDLLRASRGTGSSGSGRPKSNFFG